MVDDRWTMLKNISEEPWQLAVLEAVDELSLFIRERFRRRILTVLSRNRQRKALFHVVQVEQYRADGVHSYLLLHFILGRMNIHPDPCSPPGRPLNDDDRRFSEYESLQFGRSNNADS